VQLIEDSFGRRLDVDHYKSRVQNKIAAIIVAGDYEGAAIVTKESAGAMGSGTHVPYLDKFAVTSKSQGSGGVADIVFNVLTSSFPNDLIWRSRKSNPVNKWVVCIIRGLTLVFRTSSRHLAIAWNQLEPVLDVASGRASAVCRLC
jgi:amino-acid N-acetyltransferase